MRLVIAAIALLATFSAAAADDCDSCNYYRWQRHAEHERWVRRREYRRELRRREHRREERRDERYEERRHELSERCKEPIHAAGDADHLKAAAKRSAIHSWQAQVVNLYGERYMDYESAAIVDEHFDIAGLGSDVITNHKRYIITARPCLRRHEIDDADEDSAAPH